MSGLGTAPHVSAAIAAMAAIVLGAAACGPDGPDATVPPDEVETSIDAGSDGTATVTAPTDVAALTEGERRRAIAAAVRIRADGCGPRVGLGTGSVVDGGLVVTAAHVVAGADEVRLIGLDGSETPGIVTVFDPDLDLAVVRPDQPIAEPIELRGDDAAAAERGIAVLPREEDGVVVVEVAELVVRREANIRTTDIYLDDPVERAGFEIEASIDPGDSGALVVLPGGGVGVIWARSNLDDRGAWAIDVDAEMIRDGTSDAADVGPCIR